MFFVCIVLYTLLKRRTGGKRAENTTLHFPSTVTEEAEEAESLITSAEEKLIEFLRMQDHKFPSLCTRLELGWDWNEVTSNLIG